MGDEELRSLAAQVRTNLTLRKRSGLLGVPAGPTPRKKPAVVIVSASASASASATSPSAEAVAAGASRRKLVRDELGDCQRCGLARGRKNLVFGVGNPNAHLVFVGEAPGADEDIQGEPFVGKAGQL